RHPVCVAVGAGRRAESHHGLDRRVGGRRHRLGEFLRRHVLERDARAHFADCFPPAHQGTRRTRGGVAAAGAAAVQRCSGDQRRSERSLGMDHRLRALSSNSRSKSSASTSTAPDQSSGASAGSMSSSRSWSFQESYSISVTVPSKYWISMVWSWSSMATTSKSSLVPPRYH